MEHDRTSVRPYRARYSATTVWASLHTTAPGAAAFAICRDRFAYSGVVKFVVWKERPRRGNDGADGVLGEPVIRRGGELLRER